MDEERKKFEAEKAEVRRRMEDEMRKAIEAQERAKSEREALEKVDAIRKRRSSSQAEDPGGGPGPGPVPAERTSRPENQKTIDEIRRKVEAAKSAEAASSGGSPAKPALPSAPQPAATVHDDEMDDFMTAAVADIYTKQGLTAEAVRIYEKILSREPGNAEIRRKLDALQGKPAPAEPPAAAAPRSAWRWRRRQEEQSLLSIKRGSPLSYEQHFGLAEQPFSNAADSRYYFESSQHQEAMLRIEHSVSTMKGLTVVIGGPGAGKTLLARHVLEKLEQEDKVYDAALLVIVHSEITAEWLLRKIAMQLGVPNPAEKKGELLPQLFERLMAINEAGKKAVVIIDEANMLRSKEIFEEFRGLSNLEVPGRKLISVVLFGLPDLDELMAVDPPLVQRVAMKVTIKPLDLGATGSYIKHRMAVAGCKKEIFAADAVAAIQKASQGVPRLINTICDNALLEAYLVKKDQVHEALVQDVVMDLGLGKAGS